MGLERAAFTSGLSAAIRNAVDRFSPNRRLPDADKGFTAIWAGRASARATGDNWRAHQENVAKAK